MSVADVIQAIDGPLTVTACSDEDHSCDQYSKCNIRDPLWRIKDRIVVGAGRDVGAPKPGAPNVVPVAARARGARAIGAVGRSPKLQAVRRKLT